MKLLSLLSVAAVAASPAFAEEKRAADAHEHGVGQLDIAFDGQKVAMELHAPGADIVGFEYAAKSAEDHEAIDKAIKTLSHPLELFGLPTAAGCTVVKASAELEGEEPHEEGQDEDHKDDDHAGHDEHEEKHKEGDHDDDHKEGEHSDHKDEHKHDDHADHDEHDDEKGHTEFHAEYQLECSQPTAATKMTFAYFDIFPNAKEIELQVVTATGASAFEVEKDTPVVDLSELF